MSEELEDYSEENQNTLTSHPWDHSGYSAYANLSSPGLEVGESSSHPGHNESSVPWRTSVRFERDRVLDGPLEIRTGYFDLEPHLCSGSSTPVLSRQGSPHISKSNTPWASRPNSPLSSKLNTPWHSLPNSPQSSKLNTPWPSRPASPQLSRRNSLAVNTLSIHRQRSEGDSEAYVGSSSLEKKEPSENNFTPPVSLLEYLQYYCSNYYSQTCAKLTRVYIHRIIKSIVAFMIVIAFCLIPRVSNAIGPNANHMGFAIAYLHPARTAGAQLEAVLLTVGGVFFGLIISFAGMSAGFAYNAKYIAQGSGNGKVIEAAFFFMGMFILAFLRAKYPRLLLFTVFGSFVMGFAMTKNTNSTSLDPLSIWQFGFPLWIGGAIGLGVNVLLWPEGAVHILGGNVIDTLTLLQEQLRATSSSFVLHSNTSEKSNNDRRLKIQASFNRLVQSYSEAKNELTYSRLRPRDYEPFPRILNDLARHIAGLSLGAQNEQFLLEARRSDNSRRASISSQSTHVDPLSHAISRSQQKSSTSTSPNSVTIDISDVTFKEISYGNKDLLIIFLDIVNKPILELESTCDECMTAMKDLFVAKFDINVTLMKTACDGIYNINKTILRRVGLQKTAEPQTQSTSSWQFSQRLQDAIDKFDSSETFALHALGDRGVDQGPRDEVFLVFFFMFSLREVAKELKELATIMEGLSLKRQEGKRLSLPSVNIQKWLEGVNTISHSEVRGSRNNTTAEDVKQPEQRQDYDYWHENYKDHYIGMRIYNIFQHLTTHEFHFALKFAIAVLCLGLPGWLDSTQSFYAQSRGVWALIVVITVMTPAVGGTFRSGIYRVIGTVIGAIWAGIAFSAGGGNPYVIAVFSFIYAFPVFFIIVALPEQTSLGIISTLTYTATLFNAYLQVPTEEVPYETVWNIALRRVVANVTGVIVAIMLNWFVWPFMARVELRTALADTVYKLGLLYSNGVAEFLCECHTILPEERAQFGKKERRIQKSIVREIELLKLTRREPRIKGPFPEDAYFEMVQCCQNILDRFFAMRRAAELLSPEIMKEFVSPCNRARRDLVAAILLYFSLISSSLKSKNPLPPFLPSARTARLRLIHQMRQKMFQSHDNGQANTEYRNLFWYAYSSALEEVIEELERLSAHVKQVIGEDSSLIKGLVEKLDFEVIPSEERDRDIGFGASNQVLSSERCEGGVLLESTELTTEGIRRRMSHMPSGDMGEVLSRRISAIQPLDY